MCMRIQDDTHNQQKYVIMSTDYTITGSPTIVRQDTAPKQPLVPPTSQRQAKDSNIDDTAPSSHYLRVNSPSSCAGAAKQVIPGTEQAVTRTTQLVTSRVNPKPTPPPKPKFKYNQRGRHRLQSIAGQIGCHVYSQTN